MDSTGGSSPAIIMGSIVPGSLGSWAIIITGPLLSWWGIDQLLEWSAVILGSRSTIRWGSTVIAGSSLTKEGGAVRVG